MNPRIRMAGRLSIALVCLAASGCGDSSSIANDSGTMDSGPSPCTNAPAYAGQSSWTYAARVTPEARFCAYNTSADLHESLSQRVVLNIVPGNYKLPTAEGTHPLTLPLCISDESGQSTAAGAGSLSLTFSDFLGDTFKDFSLSQDLTLDGETWSIKIKASVLHITSQSLPLPELVLDRMLLHGNGPDTALSYTACRSGCTMPWSLYPCVDQLGAGGVQETVSFDRGNATFSVYGFGGVGPSGPAALGHATGMIDGTSFTQDSYFKLSHLPDHHNRGGGFLVMFEQAVGTVCGLQIHIPSPDGSFKFNQLEGWTLDCSGQQIDPLTNLSTPPPTF